MWKTMRMISLNDLPENSILGRSLYGFNNKLLLGAGFRLSSSMKSKLAERGYNHVYIMEEGTDDVIPEDIISDEIKFQARSMLHSKAERIEAGLKFQDMSSKKIYNLINNGYLSKMNITYDMKQMVNQILKDISSSGSTHLNSLMMKAADTYLFDHSINTTVLAVLIGQRYRFSRAELADLALGAFLHDFGKIVVEKIREGSGDDVADELLNEHSTFGYLMLRNSQDSSAIVSQIIHQHHERQDGKGYPIGLKGQNLPPTRTVSRETKGMIFRMAEICAVANGYDNLVLNPNSDKQLSPADAVREMVVGAGTNYNTDIVKTLTTIITLYPVGCYVKIVNIIDPLLIGFSGVVARINEQHRGKPVIILLHDKMKRRITPRVIDTSKLARVELKLLL